MQYTQLNDIVAVDFPKTTFRFKIIYLLSSYCFSKTIDLVTFTNEIEPLQSVTESFESAN